MDNDLISRSALLEDIAESVVFSATACTYAHQLRAVNKVTDRIKAAPAVDAVVVTRCKNCDWYNMASETCGFWPDEGYRDPMHFCGEGKERSAK